MKILLVNTYDRGGAANACLRLHEGLLDQGIDSNILFKIQQKKIVNSSVLKPLLKPLSTSLKIKNKIRRILIELKLAKKRKPKENTFIKNRDKNLELFSNPDSLYDITESSLYKEADIINLHWVSGLLDYKSFFEKNTKPVVWTLHDMNPFTGGEHYTEQIIGMDKKGFPIYRTVTDIEKKEFSKILTLKKEVLKKVNNLHIVCLCNWMEQEVKKSEVFNKFPTSIIPNGIDSSIFSPKDKLYSRELLGLPKDKKVILFVADSISNHRKGFVFLKKAFEQLDSENVVLCAIGGKNTSLESIDNIIELGAIFDERLMSIAYSAADVFVIPSLMDNLPNTVLESILCGTPVVGFPVGGIVDMIQDGENGYLAKEISGTSLLEAINKYFINSKRIESANVRRDAVEKYNINISVKLYEKCYKELLIKRIENG